MPRIEGSSSVDIDAPQERCFEIAADVGRAPEWQGTMNRATVAETDEDGRPRIVHTEADAKVATINVTLRFSYDPPHGMSWERVDGDLKSLRGSWTFEDLGGGRTRATYEMTGDPGFVLSQFARGPAAGKLRDHLVGRPPQGLKREAEA